MRAIFHVNVNDAPWFEYEAEGAGGLAPIRVKGLTAHEPDVPPVQYLEYAVQAGPAGAKYYRVVV